MTKKRDTKAKIIELTRNLVQERGYNAFSYQDLAQEMGIRKASIHYHFPAKADLGAALLADYTQRFQIWSERPGVHDGTPKEKLDGFFQIYKTMVMNCSKICPVGIFSTDFNTLPEQLQQALHDLIGIQRDWLTELVEQGQKEGAFLNDGDPKDLVSLIQAAIQGGVQITRVAGNASLFEAILSQLRATLIKG